MTNDKLRIIQSGLFGLVSSMMGYTLKTLEFWIIMSIMILQWIKENNNDN